MTAVTVGSLFAGYEGIGLALRDVFDAEPIWFSEFDKAPTAILAHHYPDVPNLGDITKIDWSTVARPTIITGGSPCQDMSHAGKRMGMKAGTRSGLWSNMLDAITALRPELVVWENVRGALSAEADSQLEPCSGCVGGDDDGPVLRALGRVLGDLAGIGYDAAWTGLRAADVGAPHGRFRVFVLAWPASADSDSATRDQWRFAADGEAEGGRARSDAGGSDRAHGLTLLPTPAVNDMGAGKTVDAWDAWTDRMQAKHGNGNGHGASLSIEALRLLPTPNASLIGPHGERGPRTLDSRAGHQVELPDVIQALLPTPRATDGTKGGPNQRGSSGDLMLPSAVIKMLPTPRASDGPDASSHGRTWSKTDRSLHTIVHTEEIAATDFGQYAAAIERWEAITRPAPSPTEPTGKGGAQRLSPAFVEWLMGLPEGWVTDVGISRNDQLKALGNGVVPQQCAAAVRYLLTVRERSLEVAA